MPTKLIVNGLHNWLNQEWLDVQDSSWNSFLIECGVANLHMHINHEAAKAHRDTQGNETMTLHGHWNRGDESDPSEMLQGNQGEMALFNPEAGVHLNACETVAHMTLDRAVHATDPSCNTSNVTKIWFPPKPK